MTKKIRAGNKGARRSKPKTHKRVELVRPKDLSPGEEPQESQELEDKPFELAGAPIVNTAPEKAEKDQITILKGNAYARQATRRIRNRLSQEEYLLQALELLLPP